MVYAKMEFALSIKTAADQNHKPASWPTIFRNKIMLGLGLIGDLSL